MDKKASIVISGATLIAPNHKLHQQKVFVQISNGKIAQISTSNIPNATEEVIDASNQFLCPGFVDIAPNFCDPGREHREDYESGSLAAIAGGITAVCPSPFTDPVVDAKSGVSYIQTKNTTSPIHIHPLGTLSVGGKNVNIPEILDMKNAGAIAFYSGKKQINERLLITSLRYCEALNVFPIVFPVLDNLAENGQINESIVSSITGLKAIPAIAEELALANYINILEYAGGKLHIHQISSAKSVALIAAAKQKGLNITCGVASHQLLHTDQAVTSFDSRHKVNPPYRLESDRLALIEACKNGTIDCIISDHEPIDIESKKIEFDLAEFGIINLQTLIPSLLSDATGLSILDIVNLCSVQPRKIFGINELLFEEGCDAEFTLVHPNLEWKFEEQDILSKSKNSPYIGNAFQTKVTGTFVKGNYFSSTAS